MSHHMGQDGSRWALSGEGLPSPPSCGHEEEGRGGPGTDLTHHRLLCSTLPSLAACRAQGAPSAEALSTLGILACPANPGCQNPACGAHSCVSAADTHVCVTLLALISLISEIYTKKTKGCIEISCRHLEVTVCLCNQVLFQGRLFP